MKSLRLWRRNRPSPLSRSSDTSQRPRQLSARMTGRAPGAIACASVDPTLDCRALAWASPTVPLYIHVLLKLEQTPLQHPKVPVPVQSPPVSTQSALRHVQGHTMPLQPHLPEVHSPGRRGSHAPLTGFPLPVGAEHAQVPPSQVLSVPQLVPFIGSGG